MSYSQLNYPIPDIQIHVPDEDSSTDYPEQYDVYPETEAEPGNNFTEASYQSVYDTNISSREQETDAVSITSLPDLNNYIVIQKSDSSNDQPSQSNTNYSRRRSSTPKKDIDEFSQTYKNEKSPERKSSLFSNEVPGEKQRRKSIVDLAPFMQPRKSIVELTPAMQARISVFENIGDYQEMDDDQIVPDKVGAEKRKLSEEELSNKERRRSIRAEVLELERRYLYGNEEAGTDYLPETKDEIQELQRRRSVRNEILGFERRGSVQDQDTFAHRRYSRESNNEGSDGDNDVVMRAEVIGPEEQISIKKKIKEMERRKSSIKDNGFNERKQEELLNNPDEDFDEEEHYIKSMGPYLKYRKSIAELEPYFHHQSEALQLSSTVQEQIAKNEDESPDYTGSSMSHAESRERKLSTRDLRAVEKVDQDISINGLSEKRESVTMEESEYADSVYRSSPRNSLSYENEQYLRKKSFSGSRGSLINSEGSLDADTSGAIPERKKSIALEVFGFLSRRLSNAAAVDDEDQTFQKTDPQDLQDSDHKSPRSSLYNMNSRNNSRKSSVAGQRLSQGSISYDTEEPEPGNRSHRLSRDSTSHGGVYEPSRKSISVEEAKYSPRGSISQSQNNLDSGDIIQYDQRRKSVTMDALDFMVRKLSSEPIPDHQSFQESNNHEEKFDDHPSSQRNSLYGDQINRSRKNSASVEDGHRSHRGSVSYEKDQRSQRGSVSSEYDRRSQRNSISIQDRQRSQRNSMHEEQVESQDISPETTGETRRESMGMKILESIARRFSNVSDNENSFIPSITVEEFKDAQEFETPQEIRRASQSSLQNQRKASVDNREGSRKNSMLVDDEIPSSRRSSTSNRDGTNHHRESISSNRSPRGSIIDDRQGSKRGSMSSDYDYQFSHRGSVSRENQRSQRNSMVMEEEISHRGSISDRVYESSPRGSISIEDNRSHRGSVSVNDGSRSHSRSASIHDGQGSQRNSLHEGQIESQNLTPEYAGEGSGDQRRKSIGMEVLEFIGRRFSNVSQNENIASNSAMEIDEDGMNYESPQGSRRSSHSSSQIHHRPSIDNQQTSRKNSMLVVEEAPSSRRSSVSGRDGPNSRKESLAVENIPVSRKGSTSSVHSKRSSRGSLYLQENDNSYQVSDSLDTRKISPRGSISNEDNRSHRGSVSVDNDSRSHSRSASIHDGQGSQRNSLHEGQIESEHLTPEYGGEGSGDQRRKSIGMEVLQFIGRRFSNVSQNENNTSNSAMEIEEEDGMNYESPQGSRRSSHSSSQIHHRPSIDNQQTSRKNSMLVAEEAPSSRRSSISARDGSNSNRDSLAVENTPVSRKGSTTSVHSKRSSRGSLYLQEADNSYQVSDSYDDIRTSPRGSISIEGDNRSHRGSVSRSRPASMHDEQRSQRNSLHEGQIESQDMSPEYADEVHGESRRKSIGMEVLEFIGRRFSNASENGEEDSRNYESAEGSRRSSRSSSYRRSSLDDNQASRKNSMLIAEGAPSSRRSSISGRDGPNSNRESLAVEDIPVSRKGSTTSIHSKRSSRGSLYLQENDNSYQVSDSYETRKTSPRGSISIEDNRSHRGSVSADNGSRSHSRSASINDGQGSQRNSLHEVQTESQNLTPEYGVEGSGDQRRKSIGMEVLEFIGRRFSNVSQNENNSSNQPAVTEEEDSSNYESPKGSRRSSQSSSINYAWSPTDDSKVSRKSSMQIDDEIPSSRKSSTSVRDEPRSQRGSMYMEDGPVSRKGSAVSTGNKRSPRGSVNYDGHRESVSAHDDRSSNRGSLVLEDHQSSRRSSSSLYESQMHKMNDVLPNETQDVVLHHFVQRSFSIETPEITDNASDTDSGSELNFELALNEIDSDSQSTVIETANNIKKYKTMTKNRESLVINKQKDKDGNGIPDLYEGLYGHIMTILTLPELGGKDYELCATFVADVTLEKSIDDTEWKELSQNLKNITGFSTPGLTQMSSLALDKTGGWATVEALQHQKERKPLDSITAVTFCGCGFLGGYLVGAATYLQESAPHVLQGKLAGSSVGSLIAACLACDIPLEYVRKNILATADVAQKYLMGPFNPFFPIEEPLLKNLLKMIPEDGHIRASGRLHLSLTRATTLTNEIVSEYSSRDELVRAILCCCFLPFISGFTVPSFNGRKYIDGGMSNNMPLKGPNTLTINAFDGDFDICPQDPDNTKRPSSSAFNQTISLTNNNFTRLVHSLLPPKSEDLDKHFEQGYNDAKNYFAPARRGSMRKL